MIRVALVDDHQMFRQLLRARLEADAGIGIVAEAGSGEEARRVVPAANPDVVLMDLHMPGIGGLEATRRLLAARRELRIIGLSMYDNGPLPARFIDLGGAGYLSKNAGAAELVDAVRRVHRGDCYVSRDVLEVIALGRAVYNAGDGIAALTGRELQILELIADGCMVAEIAAHLCLSHKTVHAHRRHLLHKLQAKNDVHLARIARENGLLP